MIFLNHCGISRMLPAAATAAMHQISLQAEKGALMFRGWTDPVLGVKAHAARLLDTESTNISYVKHTSEGLGLISAGYPFEPGDEIISYVHEYPSNHYPWRLAEKRGAKLILVPNRTFGELANSPGFPQTPCGFSLEDLENRITSRTRIIAVSHVQFPSGFACDIAKLGEIAKKRNIDLILDCAQSLGAMPIYPEKMNIAAIASSGWKWLRGPVGTGLLYTSAAFRDKISVVMAGADLMKQGMDYLDHAWNPYSDARKFEYSTHDFSGSAAISVCLEAAVAEGIESIFGKIQNLHSAFLDALDQKKMMPLLYARENRSGILSLIPANGKTADENAAVLADQGIVVSPRHGFIRIAPHHDNSVEDVVQAARALSAV
jgi:selenocysteine lyase/cysteine desulfurase